MSTPALLSSQCKIGEVPLRPSPPSQHNILRSEQAGQYDLPFSLEAAVTNHSREIDPIPQPMPACSVGETSARKDSRIERHHVPRPQSRERKPSAKETTSPNARLLVSRREAAAILSISIRGVDYLIAAKQLSTRRIGARVLIPIEEVRKFALSDHPNRMAG